MNFILKDIIKNSDVELNTYLEAQFDHDLSTGQTPEILKAIKSDMDAISKEALFEMMIQVMNYNSSIFQDHLTCFTDGEDVHDISNATGMREEICQKILDDSRK